MGPLMGIKLPKAFLFFKELGGTPAHSSCGFALPPFSTTSSKAPNLDPPETVQEQRVP